MKTQRVVITRMGAITPIGSSFDLYWNGLISGKSGVRKITQFDASALLCQIASEIPDINPELYIEQKETHRLQRSSQIALAAAIKAVNDGMTLVHGIIHPTINYSTPGPECDFDYVPIQARKQSIQYALSNSFGLGGQNACLLFKKIDEYSI